MKKNEKNNLEVVMNWNFNPCKVVNDLDINGISKEDEKFLKTKFLKK